MTAQAVKAVIGGYEHNYLCCLQVESQCELQAYIDQIDDQLAHH